MIVSIEIENSAAPTQRRRGITDAMRKLAEAPMFSSMLVPDADVSNSSFRRVASRIGGAGWVTCEAREGGVRIWKIAEPNP